MKGSGALRLGANKKQEFGLFRAKILAWYHKNPSNFPWRDKSSGCFERVIAEILLQRTKAETVSKIFPKFISRYSSWEEISKSDEKEILLFLKPLGLWRRRAESIKNLAKEMVKRKDQFPVDREEIESLPNVGQYIANSILLFCFNDKKPLLDVNMARVIEHFFGPRTLVDIRDDPYLQSTASKILNYKDPITLNWAILDFGRTICKKISPLCDECPLNKECRFNNNKKEKYK